MMSARRFGKVSPTSYTTLFEVISIRGYPWRTDV
jgi:hypothetical protein